MSQVKLTDSYYLLPDALDLCNCMDHVDLCELPETVSKWQLYADLVQILWKLGMYQLIFNLNTQGPDDDLLVV